MSHLQESSEDKTVWCGNLSEEVADEVLYELFNQAGPVESVRRPRDQSGRPKSFAFILYRHECSVPYALELFKGIKLFNRNINLNSRSNLRHIPVFDTHITEHTEPRNFIQNFSGNEPESYRSRESDYRSKREDHGNDSYRTNDRRHRGNSSRHEEQGSKEPTSWAELNALRGKGSLANGYRSDLQENRDNARQQIGVGQPTSMLDFNALLQMGQQMVINQQLGGLPGMYGGGGMMPMGLGPGLGTNMFPSMQGGMSGGRQFVSDRDRGGGGDYCDDRRDSRRDHHNNNRSSRRDHPYEDRGRHEYRDDQRRRHDSRDEHRRHDRGYSSSQSSHDREKMDRRSR